MENFLNANEVEMFDTLTTEEMRSIKGGSSFFYWLGEKIGELLG